MNKRAQFVHLSGGRKGETDEVSGDGALLGRDASQCAVHADPTQDSSVSRVHARVWFEAPNWFIEDRHSANGTRVDGQLVVTRTVLRPGATVTLSRKLDLRFEGLPDPRSDQTDPRSDQTDERAAAPRPGRQSSLRSHGEFTGDNPTPVDSSPLRPSSHRSELLMYRALAISLGLFLFLLGGSWLVREKNLADKRAERAEVRAQLTEALALADKALGFSEISEGQYVTPTGEGFVEVSKEVKEERINALEVLLSNAVKEQELAEQLGEKSRFEELLDVDPLTAHIQRMMSELTGTPLNLPVPRDFLAAVELKVQVKLNSDTKGGRYSSRDAYCRLQGIRPELRSILSGNSSQMMTAPGAAEIQQTRKVLDSLVYVAWVESQYKPTACSIAGARGMWQFIPSTARRYDMAVDQQVDERCQWRKATASAAGYFRFLLGHFDGYPFLALAAYNAGENAIDRRVIRDPDIPKHLRNFYGFTAAGVLHPETMKYVPSIVASAFIGSAAENSGKGDPGNPMADYSEARRLWTSKYPNSRRVKLWDPCTSSESTAPVNLNCRAAGARSPCKGIP